jgi:hypothetical protein
VVDKKALCPLYNQELSVSLKLHISEDTLGTEELETKMDKNLLNAKQKATAAYNATKRLLNSRLNSSEKDYRLIALAKSTFVKKWNDLENCHYEYISKAQNLTADQLEVEEESWNQIFLDHEELLSLSDDSLGQMIPAQDKTNVYKVTLITKSGWFAWFGVKNISLILVGDKKESEGIHFRSVDGQNKKSMDTYEFEIENVDVGNIQNISMSIPENDEKVIFFLEKIIVEKNQSLTEFPIYEWITNDTSAIHIFTSNKTILPQNDTEYRKRARLLQTRVSKQSLNWSHAIGGLPGSSGFLKMDEVDAKYRPPLELDLIKKEKKPIQTFMVGTAEACLGKDKTEESVWASNRDSDEEFGRQALN